MADPFNMDHLKARPQSVSAVAGSLPLRQRAAELLGYVGSLPRRLRFPSPIQSLPLRIANLRIGRTRTINGRQAVECNDPQR